MIEEKKSISLLKKKLRERVQRSSEPFRGTLVRKLVGKDSQPIGHTKTDSSSFEQKIREKVKGSDKPFCGSLGNPTKTLRVNQNS